LQTRNNETIRHIGDKETREAHKRPGIHSRLGKVRRLEKPIGYQEDMNHADDQVGIATQGTIGL